jgi:hypothetical protein
MTVLVLLHSNDDFGFFRQLKAFLSGTTWKLTAVHKSYHCRSSKRDSNSQETQTQVMALFLQVSEPY